MGDSMLYDNTAAYLVHIGNPVRTWGATETFITESISPSVNHIVVASENSGLNSVSSKNEKESGLPDSQTVDKAGL